jgi:metal-sulfur cluster biosynthetic enzyme
MTVAVTATEAEIRTALRDCYDPTLPCNIIDLGLLRTITITPDLNAPGTNIPGVPQKHRIQIALTLSNPTDDTEAQLRAQIINRLAGLQTVSYTTVTFTHNPPWTPQQITPEGRRTLGLEGNPTLVQIR